MKLASVYFDDTICIPGAKDGGSAVPRQVLREASFHAADGWEIELTEAGNVTLWLVGMPAPVTARGYGFTFVAAKQVSVERVHPWDAVGGMMREMSETGDVDRMNKIADKLETHGVPPTAAMKQAIDAILGPENSAPKPKRGRR